MIHTFIRNAAGLLYKLKAFTPPRGVRPRIKTGTIKPSKRSHNCTIAFFPLPQSKDVFRKVFNSALITCTLASWKDLVQQPLPVPAYWLKKWFIPAILIAYDPAGNLFIVHRAHAAILCNLALLINVILVLISSAMWIYLYRHTAWFLCFSYRKYFNIFKTVRVSVL